VAARTLTPEDAAALLHPSDSLAVGFGPSQPGALLEALGGRDDWKDLRVYAALLLGLYPVFAKPGVHLASAFFGPAERALRDAGHDVAFIPGDFRRFKRFAERTATRVMSLATAPPDAEGRLNLSLVSGATTEEAVRAGRDPERLLVVETSPRLPRTHGLPPEHPHAIHVDDVDVLVETEREPVALPETEPTEVQREIARHAAAWIPDRATLQTGIGGIPSAVAGLLAHGPGGDYGVHSEMFTDGLMALHRAGKVTDAHKGRHEGYSIATFAMGTRALYDWLEDREAVRFLPVEHVNSPEVVAANRLMRSINGALVLDLAGQVVADTLDGRQYSGIGGHEDFVSGASLEGDDRSLVCLPATAEVDGVTRSRIVKRLAAGSIVTTPRHQLDVVVTEYGAAEVSGLTVRDRAHALAAVAHPDFREALHDEADGIG